MQVIMAYTVSQLKRYVRTPITLVWILAFPAVLLLLFGDAQLRFLPESTRCTALRHSEVPHACAGFIMMGIIGLSAASTGLFGLGIALVQARDQGILRRLALTPQPAWKFVAGQLLASATMVGHITLLLLLEGVVVFGAGLPHRMSEWALVLLIGTMAFLSIGYALAASMHEVRTVQVVANTVFLLCMFLGNIWFPLSALPMHFQWLGRALPLAHFLDTLRTVGFYGQPVVDDLLSLGVLGMWSVGAAIVAVVQLRRNETS